MVARIPGSVLTERKREKIELDVFSSEARLRLTRLLRKVVKATGTDDSHQIELIRANKIVNLANTVLGRPIYTLELKDWDYAPAEYAWHNGELETILRRPDTVQLVEILADFVDEEILQIESVNAIFEADGSSIRLEENSRGTDVSLVAMADLPDDPPTPGEHVNVRKLIDRMDRALSDHDWSLVLHTAASTFETMAKLVVASPNVENQSLGGWFGLYRKHSKLAGPLLDTIEEIFKRRNIEPLQVMAQLLTLRSPRVRQFKFES